MRRNVFLRNLLVLLMLVLFVNTAAASYSEAGTVLFKLFFLNVGQGDAALLIDPDGFAVLIDGGKTSAGPDLTAFIRGQGIADIDVMVATHPDSDHIGGLIAVLQMEDVPVKSVMYNGYPGSTQTWQNFTAAVEAELLTLTAATYPQTFTWGAISAVTINPDAGLSSPDSNAACLAFVVQTGAVKTLFACDLDSSQESVVLNRPVDIDADLLKVGHHGSGSSSSTAFLSAVTPLEAFISVGDNSYGHPDPAAIARLEAAGARIWRTDQVGHITVLTDGVNYAVNQDLPVDSLMVKIFLPLIVQNGAPPATVTPTPQPTDQVMIGTIFFDGVIGSSEPDEYVEIINMGAEVQLQGWTLSDNQNHVYSFPSFAMQPGQACRVYTNQSHPQTCGFSYGSGTAIWNNSGDCAILRNAQGDEVSTKCYP